MATSANKFAVAKSADQGKVTSDDKIIVSAFAQVIQAGTFSMYPVGVITVNMPSRRRGHLTTRKRCRKSG